ncbi:hypothetical protein ASE00_16430 [Sphingomonas sp. Root710]|uniref:hypothetical protein n=1 Tax=Sphingomonas sp. Root710 TaxID=1736594 RepID=UPI0006F4BB38|nr:hypothetical protein [Sphingomonas sp. Root710]KRB80632.1 hypothetical protein ASE00_16430 [Sphingomonas sp. Root710]
MSKIKAVDQLDALLLGCEDMILSAADRDVPGRKGAEVDATASFIALRLAQRRLAALPVGVERRTPRGTAARRAIPRDAAGRRRLLGRLIASRPELPTRISMAFKSREPQDEEIAEMLEELLRSEDGPVAE